jgi:hypothetical protein
MRRFEECYNADNADGCAAAYAKDCLVTVNGGVEKGGVFTGKTPGEVVAFLRTLRNSLGGTNIKVGTDLASPSSPAHFD